jgi:acyl-CoA synthetase (AMP-forming)/AMP-acid ligase II
LPEKTEEVFTPTGYRSRDLGFINAGELFVLGRTDDLIIAYGRNFMAHEIEQVVSGVEGVKPGRSAAFGIDSDALGTREIAVLFETQPGADPKATAVRVRAALEGAAGMTPRYIVPVPLGGLEKTTSGKVSRSLNKAQFESALVRATAEVSELRV